MKCCVFVGMLAEVSLPAFINSLSHCEKAQGFLKQEIVDIKEFHYIEMWL